LTLAEARGRIPVIRKREGEVRPQMAPLVERTRREQDPFRPQDLEVPLFDLSDQNDWIEDAEAMVRISAPGRGYGAYTDNREHCFRTIC
jgi:hypothetical protein